MSSDQDNEWDAYADGWDEEAAVQLYASSAFSSLQDLVADMRMALDGAHVLDFGCGTGLLTERLVSAGATVLAMDTSPAMLAALEAKIARNSWTSVTTAAELSDVEPVFDLIVCSSVCSFLSDYPGTVQDLVSRLRPGGLFVQWDWEQTDDDPTGLSRHEIREALDRAGLDEIAVRVAFHASIDGETMRPLIGYGRQS